MRSMVVAVTFVALALAGCSDGGGMSAFLIRPADLAADCAYAAVDGSAELRELSAEYDWDTNPGLFDAASAFDGDFGNTTPVHGMLAVIECDQGEAFSWALSFRTANEAVAVAQDMADCDDWAWPVLLGGTVVSSFDIEAELEFADEAEEEQFLRDLMAKMESRSGGEFLCKDKLFEDE